MTGSWTLMVVVVFTAITLTCVEPPPHLSDVDKAFIRYLEAQSDELEQIPQDSEVSTAFTESLNVIRTLICLDTSTTPQQCLHLASTATDSVLVDIESLLYQLDFAGAYRILRNVESEMMHSPSSVYRLIFFQLFIKCLEQRVIYIDLEEVDKQEEQWMQIAWPHPLFEKYAHLLLLSMQTQRHFMTNAYREALIPCFAALAFHRQHLPEIQFPGLYRDFLYLIGTIYSHDEPYPLAEAYFRQAYLKSDPANYEGREMIKTNLLLLAYLQEDRQTQDSLLPLLSTFDSIRLTPKLRYNRHRILGYYNLYRGDPLAARGHFVKALAVFDTADNCNKYRMSLYHSLAEVYLYENRIDSAAYYNALALFSDCVSEHMHPELLWHTTKTHLDIQYVLCRTHQDTSYCNAVSRTFHTLKKLSEERFDIEDVHHSDAAVYTTEEYLNHLISVSHLYNSDSLHEEVLRVMRSAKYRALIRGLARADRDIYLEADEFYRKASRQMNTLLQQTNDLKSPERQSDSIYLALYDHYRVRRTREKLYQAEPLPKTPVFEDHVLRKIKNFSSSHNAQIFQFLGTSNAYYTTYFSSDTSAFYRVPRAQVDSCIRIWNAHIDAADTLNPDVRYSLLALTEMLLHNLLDQKTLNLIVLPDLNLEQFPFEILFTHAGQDNRYIIEDHVVSYHYDLHQLLIQTPTKEKIQRVGVLSWSDEQTLRTGGAEIQELPGGYLEGKGLCDLTKTSCTMWAGEDLSPANFEKALQADLLHISTHAASSNFNRLDNYFLLRQDHKPLKYYAYNLPTQKDHMKHVILSACESGTGKYFAGDGVYSISREFIRAGSHVVTKSLWKISDIHTASLFKVYYEELFKGHPAPEALRTAKLSKLSQSRTDNLLWRWAGLVVEGHPFISFTLVSD